MPLYQYFACRGAGQARFGIAAREPSRPRQDVTVEEGVLTRAEERQHVALSRVDELGPAASSVDGDCDVMVMLPGRRGR